MLWRITNALGINEVPQSWDEHFERAMEQYPNQPLFFLQLNYYENFQKYIALSTESIAGIQQAIEYIVQNDNYTKLAWLWHYLLYIEPTANTASPATWTCPNLPDETGQHSARYFPAIIVLSGLENIIKFYQDRNIPEDVIKATLGQVQHCMDLFKSSKGRNGLSIRHLNWLQHHFHGRLFSLGRLEFEMRKFQYPLRVYRHKDTGVAVCLSEPRIQYRTDGLVDGTNEIEDENKWTSNLLETPKVVRGYPITGDKGLIARTEVELSKVDWELQIERDDLVLHVHIPRDRPFHYEACRDSFARAAHFFKTYFPDKPYAGVVCVSWLMDPQLGKVLPETSNLLQFQKWYHLFPVKSGDESLFTFVFNCEPCPPDQLPEKTSLQRKMKHFMQSGDRFHLGGGFILPEHLGKGPQPIYNVLKYHQVQK